MQDQDGERQWGGHSSGEGTAVGRAQQWGGHSSGEGTAVISDKPDAALSNNPGAYLNFQVVVISAIVALPQVLVEHHTVHRLPWTLHIAAHNQIES